MTSLFDNETAASLQWHRIIDTLAGRCQTEQGIAAARNLTPLKDRREIELQLLRIESLREAMAQHVSPDFTGLADLSSITARLDRQGTLMADELLQIRKFTALSQRTASLLGTNEFFSDFHSERDALHPLKELHDILNQSLKDDGTINEQRYPALRQLRNRAASARKEIITRIEKVFRDTSLDAALQEKVYNERNNRFVILVKATHRGAVKGSVLDISSSGATVYMEPDSIRESNSTFLMAQREIEAEEGRIYEELSFEAARWTEEITQNQEILARMDMLAGAARLAEAMDAVSPTLLESPELRIYEARHPLLALLSPDTLVANDIIMEGRGRNLILTGANTGGKTVLLTTVGLLTAMLRHGLQVPVASNSSMGFFSSIFADIGDDQNLDQSLSTFSGQLARLETILAGASEDTLVLLDEIIVGTNPRQGASLAQAYLEALADRRVLLLVTTHYPELKEMAAGDDRFRNGSVTFNLSTLQPEYRLVMDIPGLSYAFEIARRCGLNEKVLERAYELADDDSLTVEALVEKVQALESELQQKKEESESLLAHLRRKEEKLNEREESVKRRIREVEEKEGIQFIDEMKRWKEQLAARMTDLQNLDQKEMVSIQRELQDFTDEARSKLDERKNEKAAERLQPVSIEALQEGDRVFIATMEKEGTIHRIDTRKKTVEVIVGNGIRFTVSAEHCFHSPATSNDTNKRHTPATRKTPEKEQIPLTLQTSYNTVDLRGERVDQALIKLDSGLDRMVQSGIGTAVIIHGHGTGALKEAVRQHLQTSWYSNDFRAGGREEGGDGVTIVQL